MPAVYQLPQAPNTGLSSLASVLLGGATDYANNKRADDREARARTNRLADVADERAFVTGREQATYDRNRTDRLADITEQRTYSLGESKRQAADAIRKELIDKGYLGTEFIDAPLDSEAVKVAFEAARRAGLVKNDPFVQEGVRRGIVTADALGDPAMLASQIAQVSQQIQKEAKAKSQFEEDAQTRLDQLATRRDDVRGRQSKLDATLAEPDPTVDPNRVRQLAYAAAKAAIPKAGFFGTQRTEPSEQEIAQYEGAIREKLQGEAFGLAERNRRDAIVQKDILGRESQDIGAEANTLTNISRRVGRAGSNLVEPVVAPQTAPTTSAKPSVATARQNFAATKAPPATVATPSVAAPAVAVPDSAPSLPVRAFNRLTDVFDRRVAAPVSDLGATVFGAPVRAMKRAFNVETLTDTLMSPFVTPGQNSNPADELRALERRLSTLPDPNALEAQTVRNRIMQLRSRLLEPTP